MRLATLWGATKNITKTTPVITQSTTTPSARRRMRKAVTGGRGARLWVECVAHAVAEQVERQRREQERGGREEHVPPGHLVEAERLRQHVPPRRGGWDHAEAEKGQRRLEHDRGGDQEGHVDEHGREQVREDVHEHDPDVARAERARRLDVLL